MDMELVDDESYDYFNPESTLHDEGGIFPDVNLIAKNAHKLLKAFNEFASKNPIVGQEDDWFIDDAEEEGDANADDEDEETEEVDGEDVEEVVECDPEDTECTDEVIDEEVEEEVIPGDTKCAPGEKCNAFNQFWGFTIGLVDHAFGENAQSVQICHTNITLVANSSVAFV